MFTSQRESKQDLIYAGKQDSILEECKKIAENVKTARMLEKKEKKLLASLTEQYVLQS